MPVSFLTLAQRERYGRYPNALSTIELARYFYLDDDDLEWINHKRRDFTLLGYALVNFRFPGHEKVRMVESELGKIPEGWDTTRLGEVLTLEYGKALKEADRHGGPVPVYGSSGVVGYHSQTLTAGPGIIVGRKGNVGSVFFCPSDFWVIDTAYYVRSELSPYFLYFNLLSQNFLNNDAAVPGVKGGVKLDHGGGEKVDHFVGS